MTADLREPFSARDCNAIPARLIGNHTNLGETLLEALDRVGYGGFVVNGHGDVSAINATGRSLLERIMERRAGVDEADWLRQAVRRLQNRATPWFPRDAESWVTISSSGDGGGSERPLVLYRSPLAEGEGHSQSVLMILADFGSVPHPNPATLRRIFGLTAAEAKLAVQIGQGDVLADIARENNVCVATVRSQLASVFAKTRTCRQAELGMLLARMAILP